MRTLKTCLDDTGGAIKNEIYRALESLGADSGLLGCVGSWGDTLDDADVLKCIRWWNERGEPFTPEDPAKD